MEKDSIYRVRLFASAAEDNVYACDCLEVWLTDYVVEVPQDSLLIQGNPQLTTPEGYFLADTLEWMELCWLYKAQGGEQYMIIGSFKGNTAINTIMVDSVVSDANIYFYIEDVSIEKAPFHLVDLALGEDRIECQSVFSDTLMAGGAFESYLWSTGDTTQSIVVTEPGLYWVEGSSGGMCSMRDTIQVVYLDPQTLSLEPDLELCPQDFPYLLEGPGYMESYLWSNGDTSPGLEVQNPGLYTLQATHACGVFSDTVSITSLAPPIELGNDTVNCGQPVFQQPLTAPTGYDSYLWSTSEISQGIIATTPGVYWVQASNVCGQFSDTIVLTNQPLLNLDLGPDTIRCLEEGYLLDAGSGFDYYFWNTGATAPAITATEYGTYWVEAGYVCGILSDSILISEPPPFSLSLPADTTIQLGSEVLLQAEFSLSPGPFSFQWTPVQGLSCADCPQPVAAPVQSTAYTLVAENGYGCRASDQIGIRVENPARVYIPNTFSPNADGTNDRFAIYGGPEVAEVVSLLVYDRWGGLVFLAKGLPADGKTGWDGRVKGKDAPAGAYTFTVEIAFLNGDKMRYSGGVTVVR